MRTAHWVKAAREGMAPVLSEYVNRNRAHFEYQEPEYPVYGQCICCGDKIRVDRLDLIAEHLRVCTEFKPSFIQEHKKIDNEQ